MASKCEYVRIWNERNKGFIHGQGAEAVVADLKKHGFDAIVCPSSFREHQGVAVPLDNRKPFAARFVEHNYGRFAVGTGQFFN